MRKFYVYAYVVNDIPFYIGKGHGNRDQRHLLSCLLNKKDWFHNTLRSYINRGYDIQVIRLFEGMSESEAFAWEIGLIAHWGRRDLETGILCNMTNGGEGVSGLVVSDEVRKGHAERGREKMRTLNADPIFAAARDERTRAMHNDPAFAAAQAERMHTLNADPIFAAARDERTRAMHNDPAFAATNAKRSRERIRKRYKNNRVAAFEEFWYKTDLAKNFGINYGTLDSRIRSGISPFWSCMYSPGQGKPYPDYCKPAKIEEVFGDILRVNSEAIEWLYFSDNLKD